MHQDNTSPVLTSAVDPWLWPLQGRKARQAKVEADRRRRIAERKKEARETTSSVKRTLLVALNMAENFMLDGGKAAKGGQGKA